MEYEVAATRCTGQRHYSTSRGGFLRGTRCATPRLLPRFRTVMRVRLLVLVVLGILATSAPAPALAGGWSSVSLPRHAGFATVSCTSTRWCLARGGWGDRAQLGRWNGSRWTVSTNVPNPKGATVIAVTCRSPRFCVAVGQLSPRETQPVSPLVERWDGHRWTAGTAPKPAAARGSRGVNARLNAVACPSAKLCFAVGQAVPFGAGAAPGAPLIERWNGARWSLVSAPTAGAPLTSISCPTSRSCTAVGGFEHEVGTPNANNQQIQYPSVVEHWDGRSWSVGSLSAPPGTLGGGLLGISCTQAHACLGVGDAFEPAADNAPGGPTGDDQAIAAPGDGAAFTASTLAFPPSVYRSPASAPPTTVLSAISCASATSCAAVGRYAATSGALGPLAATWNGITWTQIALRRGPVALTSVSCPRREWCMAVGGGIAERLTG